LAFDISDRASNSLLAFAISERISNTLRRGTNLPRSLSISMGSWIENKSDDAFGNTSCLLKNRWRLTFDSIPLSTPMLTTWLSQANCFILEMLVWADLSSTYTCARDLGMGMASDVSGVDVGVDMGMGVEA